MINSMMHAFQSQKVQIQGVATLCHSHSMVKLCNKVAELSGAKPIRGRPLRVPVRCYSSLSWGDHVTLLVPRPKRAKTPPRVSFN